MLMFFEYVQKYFLHRFNQFDFFLNSATLL